MLIVGDVILIGSAEIPQKFPGIVEQGLADGGIAWPDFPGLAELLAAQGLIAAESSSDVPSPSAQPPVESPVASIPATAVAEAESVRIPTELSITTDLAETKDQTLAQRFAQDKAGNTLSVLVLLGTVGLLLWVVRMVTYPTPDVVIRPRWVMWKLAKQRRFVAQWATATPCSKAPMRRCLAGYPLACWASSATCSSGWSGYSPLTARFVGGGHLP
jgi:hypothetical protein